jgi:hypothetical protein
LKGLSIALIEAYLPTERERERERERDYRQSSFMVSNMIEFACNCEHNLQDKKIPQAGEKKNFFSLFHE